MTADTDECCDYCGERGHDWTVHEQAHVDVARWKRQEAAERDA